jgi:hypothetical protein
MNAKPTTERVAELRANLAKMRGAPGMGLPPYYWQTPMREKDYADLLSLLALYEAAMPLIEMAESFTPREIDHLRLLLDAPAETIEARVLRNKFRSLLAALALKAALEKDHESISPDPHGGQD